MPYKELYEGWLVNRKLTHPEPKKEDYSDLTLSVVQGLVILGSMALSGTRVGTTLARVGVFQSFGESFLNPGHPILPLFTLAEWGFAFLTIEAAIFLAGYLTGDGKEEDVNWYWGLLFAALGTSLAANIFPMFVLIGGQWEHIALIIVSVITGLCTSIMPYIGGRVLIANKFRATAEYQSDMAQWLTEVRRAWSQSSEYKQWKKGQEKQPQGNVPSFDLAKIAIWLAEKNNPVSLDIVGREFGVEQNFLMSKFEEDSRFSLDGFKVFLNGNSQR
jgi:hypothetical protein